MGLFDTPNRTVKTADTVFEMIRYLRESNGGTVTEIADALDIAESTAHTYLATLFEHEYVVKDGSRYGLSLKPLDNGMVVRNTMDLTTAARSVINQVAEETDEVVWIVVEEHGRAVYLMKSVGEKAVQTRGRIGKRTPLHDIAAGKAILANLPISRVEAIINRYGLPERTGSTITNPDTLFEELETIRDRGFAMNRGETIQTVHAVASPILKKDEVQGAIGIAGPKNRLSGDHFTETLPNVVCEAADTIELELTYH
ncbi:IclR family transcriptional regulator [Halopenitus persicus]|uniref:Transcriptional regulator, IclR family n=1 Tax=Halopenitus persicus TaxID=1048396 RepID=A0A1H3K148_9EURY|nr:IclR family transcriptional regulator [Halopenitus persicus]SDY45940.1 transcriptional regulator, IclR family [Halopenitus persicus]